MDAWSTNTAPPTLPTPPRPEGPPPSGRAERVEQAGRYVLWRVPTHGYLQLVDVVGPPIVADRTNIGLQAEPFLDSGIAGRGVYRSVAVDGEPAAPAATTDTHPATPPGIVTKVSGSLNEGTISADVVAERPSA